MTYVVTKEQQDEMWRGLAAAFKRGHRRSTGQELSDTEAARLADAHMSKFPGIYAIGEHPDIMILPDSP